MHGKLYCYDIHLQPLILDLSSECFMLPAPGMQVRYVMGYAVYFHVD